MTVKGCPAIVIVPLLSKPELYPALNRTIPSPVPILPLVTVSHDSSELVAVQAQAALVATFVLFVSSPK